MSHTPQSHRDLQIIILMGVSGSGKTTIGQRLAKDLGWQFFEGDDFHPQRNVEKMQQGIPLTDEDRLPWLQTLRNRIHDLLATSQRAVVTCSALKQAYRQRLTEGYPQVSFVYLRGDYDLIRRRLKSREHQFMNPDLLTSQFETLEEPEDVPSVDIIEPPDAIVPKIRQMLKLMPME
jgi:gluconokinase